MLPGKGYVALPEDTAEKAKEWAEGEAAMKKISAFAKTMPSEGEPRTVSTLPVQATFFGSVSPKVDSQLCWAPIRVPHPASERAAQPAASHRNAGTANLSLVNHVPMFAIIHDTRIYRYFMARYARAAPTAMPRASSAISLATRWRFTHPPPSS